MALCPQGGCAVEVEQPPTCPRQLARNRAAQRAAPAAVDDDDGSSDSRPTLPPSSDDGDSSRTRSLSPQPEPGSPASPVQPSNEWPDLEPEDEPHVERHAGVFRNFIAGDGPHSFTGSGRGGALSPLFMVLVHHGLRRNGIALPVGVMLNGATPGPLWGGPVEEAAWQSVFASAARPPFRGPGTPGLQREVACLPRREKLPG